MIHNFFFIILQNTYNKCPGFFKPGRFIYKTFLYALPKKARPAEGDGSFFIYCSTLGSHVAISGTKQRMRISSAIIAPKGTTPRMISVILLSGLTP